jgi:hypothetical protein
VALRWVAARVICFSNVRYHVIDASYLLCTPGEDNGPGTVCASDVRKKKQKRENPMPRFSKSSSSFSPLLYLMYIYIYIYIYINLHVYVAEISDITVTSRELGEWVNKNSIIYLRTV